MKYLLLFLFFVSCDSPKQESDPYWDKYNAQIHRDYPNETPAPPAKVATDENITILKKSDKAVGYGMHEAFVRVKNESDQNAYYIAITTTYYSSDGSIVGTGLGNTLNLASGKERTINCIASQIEGAKTYDVEITQVQYK